MDFSCKNWYKNWYLHFYKSYDHHILQAGTSTGFDLNETYQAGAGDVIMSRSRDKLKTYLHYQSAYGHQTWQDANLPWWVPAHKITWSFWSLAHVRSRDKLKSLYLYYHGANDHQTWQDGNLP